MDARWYVVNVHSGCEKKVAQSIKEQVMLKKWDDRIFDILIPMEEVVEVKKGQKVASERKFFPGYILINMIMSDEAWHLIKNNPNVSGFLGSRNKPYPVTQAEVDRIMTQMQEGVKSPREVVNFEIGEQVRVCDGPFASFVGLIEDVDVEKARVKVSVSIFGRATPVELEYAQVEKI
ncbi:MAG: transcription termination/antitermination protein NusG [Alphaproteobacteria bacterium]|nr:transcription termination/antitermination protein NusG [Alphaproteobacteria bacterium]